MLSTVAGLTLASAKQPLGKQIRKRPFLRALVDREAEARLQQQSRRQQQADDLFRRALGIVNRERQNRLVGLQAEVARRVANFLLRLRIAAANLGPLGLNRDEVGLHRPLRLLLLLWLLRRRSRGRA